MKGKSKMKRTVSCFVVLAVLAIVPSVLRAAVLEVPEAYATVEAALAAAVKGDTVRVAPGEYMLADYAGITVPSGVTLEGTGNSPEDTVFKAYSATASDTTSASLLYVTNGIVRNLTFKGARCISDNTTAYRALYAIDEAFVANCVFTDTQIDVNKQKTLTGKVAAITRNSKIENSVVRNTTFKNQTTYQTLSGAVVVLGSDSEMTGCYVTNNVSSMVAYGVVYLAGSSRLLKSVVAKNTILSHEKHNYATAGVRAQGDGCLIEDCIIERNKVESSSGSSRSNMYKSAGGLILYGGTTVRRTIVRNNTTVDGFCGGVIACYGASILENLLITGNEVTKQYGASTSGIHYSGGLLLWQIDQNNNYQGTKIYNCTVSDNKVADIEGVAGNFGSHGVYTGSYKVDFFNCIFAGNGIGMSSQRNIGRYNTGKPLFTTCWTSSDDPNTISGVSKGDPLFVNAEKGDFRLSDTSPCIDAGKAVAGVPLEDLKGVSRPQRKGIDIGCYEYLRRGMTVIVR